METKEQRIKDLYNSGMVDTIKQLFYGKHVNISEEYYVLIADYIDSLNEVEESFSIKTSEIAKKLPQLISNIQETNLGGIYGITDENGIKINQSLDYESKKLYFFHELTHALQTRNINGQEQCSFFDGHNGMFLTEGATQYTAEILYHVSNGTNINYRNQSNTVRGDYSRTTYSPLSEYQYNGNMLMLLCKTMGLPLPQVLALGFKSNGRDTLKKIYESMNGNQGKFDELMQIMEKIYSIDKLIIGGYGKYLEGKVPTAFVMNDGTEFSANYETYKNLMDKVENELISTFIHNNPREYVLKNSQEFAQYLTTPELKNLFLSKINELQISSNSPKFSENNFELSDFLGNDNNLPQFQNISSSQQPVNFTINKFGEIIREPESEENIKDSNKTYTESDKSDMQLDTNIESLSLKQKLAKMLQKNNLFMKIPFIERFVNKQLNVLPPAETNIQDFNNLLRNSFLNRLSNNGEYKNLPPVKTMTQENDFKQPSKDFEQEDSR